MFDEQPEGDPHSECSAEICRLETIGAELAEALRELVEVYCGAHDDMSRAEREYDRKVLIRARAALGLCTPTDPKRPSFAFTPEQVSALYLCLLHDRTRPAFGWMEPPLVEVEAMLRPANAEISGAQFDAMDRHYTQKGPGAKKTQD